jgi:hypothetical protein
VPARPALSTPLSHVLVAFTIELDNEFERRLAKSGHAPRVTSFVMWANLLRFVGDGIPVGELPKVSGLPKARTLSAIGGLERWRYVAVGPESDARRDGYGSGRGLRSDWLVRLTPEGHAAAEIWRSLPDEIEARWRERFGTEVVDELRGALESIAAGVDLELPEFLPIVASTNGMRTELAARESRLSPPNRLSALLSHALLMYTLDFERRSDLSLPLSANVVRILDEAGASVDELPQRAGVSKEAIAMALTSLTKDGRVVVEDKVVRLTTSGRDAQQAAVRVHAAVEEGWRERFGADSVSRLRSALDGVLEQREALSGGLAPYESGWRAGKRYAARTRAVVGDPAGALPQYPMVLPRGGWPDGS